jgi:hemoglobin
VPDLDRRAEVHDLVVAFYREIVFDDVLAPVFTEVAEVDWAEHIPKLIDYWCRVLLDEIGYRGSLLAAHRHVHDQVPFEPVHFERWLRLWNQSIDRRWSGPKAEQAKAHAAHLGGVIARHISGATAPTTSRPTVAPASDDRAATRAARPVSRER